MARPAKTQETPVVSTDTKKCVVEPSVKIDGHVNPFIEIFEKSQPEFSSIGLFKIPNTNQYVSFTMHIKGTEIVKIVCDEPNLKGITTAYLHRGYRNDFLSL